MRLSISKRFDFSSSHRLVVPGWSEKKNRDFFGKESMGPFGHGHNFTAYFGFNGPVDVKTGMMINVTVIKERIKRVLDSRFDHKFLNEDTPPFDVLNPTAENLARQLLEEVKPLFAGEAAKPVVCHLEESPGRAATAYADGTVERHLHIDFSASRRTYSPHLTEAENKTRFGIAASPSGHGHHYRLRVTLSGEPDPLHGTIFPEQEGERILRDLHVSLDHKNLTSDLPPFKTDPNTTEVLARFIYGQLAGKMPVSRVRLDENDHFFVEYTRDRRTYMSVSSDFFAAHRLHSRLLSDSENLAVYNICNNPKGHGHHYRVECTVTGPLDERSGTVYDLGKLSGILESELEPWNYKHLDMETEAFRDRPSTGENIVHALRDKLAHRLEPELHRLRLWETVNNRFTLRK